MSQLQLIAKCEKAAQCARRNKIFLGVLGGLGVLCE